MALAHGPARQRGVALAILLWFIAAMTLLVSGIVLQARTDIRLAQLHTEEARAESAGDGAIQLALAELLLLERTGERDGPAGFSTVQQVGDYRVVVTLTPVSGLVDLNQATVELLATLLASVEDIDEGSAEELAQRMVDWRSAAGADEDGALSAAAVDAAGFGLDSAGEQGERDIRNGEFEAIEDLLLVAGVDRRIFEAIKDAVYVSRDGGQTGVDWNSAPATVLRALGDIDEASAYELMLARLDALDDSLPPEEFMAYQQSMQSSIYRVDALVQGDSTVYQRRRWVDRGRSGFDGLPWIYLRTDDLIAASGMSARLYGDVEALHGGT